MRAFVCVGVTIIISMIVIGLYAERCRECCAGEPCNPELRASMIADGALRP